MTRFQLHDLLGEVHDDLAGAVLEGLSSSPRSLPCRFLYDAEGSLLFERICALEEYYPTRAEREILADRADELAGLLSGTALVELGSGSAKKTEVLLAALCRRGDPVTYVPVDISRDAIERSAARLIRAYPELTIQGVAAEYGAGLAWAVEHVRGPKTVLWLGSNVGNFTRPEAGAFLARLRESLVPGDHFLIGVDRRKDRRTLELAYDDPGGVTAAFNLNLLARINRELGGELDVTGFTHRASYDEEEGVVRMDLVSDRAQSASIAALERVFHFEEGEAIHTEDSVKYSGDELDRLAAAAGFAPVERWTDGAERFFVDLWVVPG